LDVVVKSKGNPSISAYMPQDFSLSLSFILRDGNLTVNALMENHSDESIPFGLGFHPYFLAPLAGSGSQEQCFIRVPANKRWELDECFPTGKALPVEGVRDLREWSCLEGRRLDDDYFDLIAEGDSYVCGYEDRGAGIGLEFTSGLEYPQWVIFTGKETDRFVCLEPYTMMTNAFNLELPEEMKGKISLGSGEKFKGTMNLRPYLI
jgi:aldose 1-epimerase